TRPFAEEEARAHPPLTAPRPFRTTFVDTTLRDRSLSAVCQAGFVNNLNDAMVWRIVPIFLAHEASANRSDRRRRRDLPGGLGPRSARHRRLVRPSRPQASHRLRSLAAGGRHRGSRRRRWLLGLGRGLARDGCGHRARVPEADRGRRRSRPAWRASSVAVYRLWRDLGYAAGGLLVGITADAVDEAAAIVVVGLLTALSGLVVALRMQESSISSRYTAPT